MFLDFLFFKSNVFVCLFCLFYLFSKERVKERALELGGWGGLKGLGGAGREEGEIKMCCKQNCFQ